MTQQIIFVSEIVDNCCQLLEFALAYFPDAVGVVGSPWERESIHYAQQSCPQMLLTVINKAWALLKLGKARFSYILEIQDSASYSHDQEQNGSQVRNQGEILSKCVSMIDNEQTKSMEWSLIAASLRPEGFSKSRRLSEIMYRYSIVWLFKRIIGNNVRSDQLSQSTVEGGQAAPAKILRARGTIKRVLRLRNRKGALGSRTTREQIWKRNSSDNHEWSPTKISPEAYRKREEMLRNLLKPNEVNRDWKFGILEWRRLLAELVSGQKWRGGPRFLRGRKSVTDLTIFMSSIVSLTDSSIPRKFQIAHQDKSYCQWKVIGVVSRSKKIVARRDQAKSNCCHFFFEL
jgi:hypothetical protein